MWEEEHSRETLNETKKISASYEAKGRKALDDAKIELVKLGFNTDNIFTKFQSRKFSKIRDIINEGEKGHYDALVLGRRGLSWLEEAFDESTSKEFLLNKATFPIWLCRNSNTENKNVLICLDGSEASYRIADHVGYILGNDKRHGITILTINTRGKINKEKSDTIFANAIKHITANGFSPDTVSTRFLTSDKTADNIIRIAKEGRFAAVAVGHDSKEQGFFRRLFSGSVCSRLSRELEKTALWIQH